ncbi:hypothetical protein XPU_4084 [Xanthomonas arboricola pv. pruni str. MAFF 311562]|uniref:Uncharacterized protein n=1 Tax=Xanthomonas arboricola pv. pruni str. MAFF 311562 TaxID=1414836 RepID=W4S890_9XANT|nr:hypothetical protein XPU_4084 [Xanthomonas arboricola pv. pruni str. MAFF 311562]
MQIAGADNFGAAHDGFLTVRRVVRAGDVVTHRRVWQNTETTATPSARSAEDSPEASQRGTAEAMP